MCIVNINIMYQNVLITTYLSNTTSNVKFSEIKELTLAFCLLLECSLLVVDLSKIHIKLVNVNKAFGWNDVGSFKIQIQFLPAYIMLRQ